MPSPSTIFTEMVTATDRNWGKDVADNISGYNILYYQMKKKNRFITEDGGYEIARPLEYGENSTYQRYAGYDALNTGASDILTSAKYDWQQVALHVVSSGREVRMNMGSEQKMIDLVKTKKRNALKTAANQFSIDLFSDGSLPNQINGLANIIQTNGQGTVGGIDSATWTFWRNRFREMTGTNLAASPSAANAASLKADMNALWLSLDYGADKPDVLVFTHDLYALYELGEQQLQRYADADMAESGFNALRYKSAMILPDTNANFATTGERGYFLNTDYFYVVQHTQAKWTPDEEKRPTNQDAVVVPIYWMGNAVCTNRRMQGILFDAA